MSWLRQRWLPLTVLVAASGLLAASIVFTVGRDNGEWSTGLPMMGTVSRGDGPVGSLDAAGRAADR